MSEGTENQNYKDTQSDTRRDVVIPPQRRFDVVRYKPGVMEPALETVTVNAHTFQFNNTGKVVMFIDYIVDPMVGPTTRMHTVLNGYVEIREVNVPQPSSIIH